MIKSGRRCSGLSSTAARPDRRARSVRCEVASRGCRAHSTMDELADAPTLFDDLHAYPRSPVTVATAGRAEPRPPGELSRLRGQSAETLVDAKGAGYGGIAEKTTADDQPYDRIVFWNGLRPTVQVKFAACNDGRAKFNLGPRAGPNSDRRQPYNGRADFFALLTHWRERDWWYVIPSDRLRGMTTLTITPGRYRRRQRRGPEPESFREAFHLLAGEPREAFAAVGLF